MSNNSEEKISIDLSVDDLDKWNESWNQPAKLAQQLQTHILIYKITIVILGIAAISLMVATWYTMKNC